MLSPYSSRSVALTIGGGVVVVTGAQVVKQLLMHGGGEAGHAVGAGNVGQGRGSAPGQKGSVWHGGTLGQLAGVGHKRDLPRFDTFNVIVVMFRSAAFVLG